MFHYAVLRCFTMICPVFHAFFIYIFLQQSSIGCLYIGMFHFLNVMCYWRIYGVHLRVGTCSNLCLLFLCAIMNCVPQFSHLILICCFFVFFTQELMLPKPKAKAMETLHNKIFSVHGIRDHECNTPGVRLA